MVSINKINPRDRWAWRRYSDPIETAVNTFDSTAVFTRNDVVKIVDIDLTTTAKRAAVSVVMDQLVRDNKLVKISKTRFSRCGADDLPLYLEGAYVPIWLNHGRSFQGCLLNVEKNVLMSRCRLLNETGWLPDKTYGTRYSYFSMIEKEVVGRGLISSQNNGLYIVCQPDK